MECIDLGSVWLGPLAGFAAGVLVTGFALGGLVRSALRSTSKRHV